MPLAAPLLDRVRALLAANPTAAAGKLQMLGISEIRERLGDRWAKSREQIMSTIDRMIKNEMGAGDVVFEVDELAYIILFSGRTSAESRLICAKIAQDVCRKLFGEDEDVVRVRSLTCDMNGDVLVQDVDISASVDALLETEGEEQVFGRDGIAEAPEAVEQKKPEPIIQFIYGSMPVSAPLSRVQFLYSPIWDVSKRVVVSYLCRAHIDDSNARARHGERFLLAEETEHQTDLDIKVIEDCVAKISDLKAQNRRVIIVCPIHWSTISRGRSWERFRGPLQQMAKIVAQDLVICVHGLDAGLPNIRISQEFPKISNKVRAVHACVAYGDKAAERFANTHTAAVGFSMPEDARDERTIMLNAREFCIVAESKNLPAFVYGVSTRSTAMSFVGVGFRYLEGSAIRTSTAAPRDAFVHDTIDLFRKDLQRLNEAS